MLDLAATQHGLVGRAHLARIGLTTDHWWRARRNGRWEAIWEDDLWRFDRAGIAVLDSARSMAQWREFGVLHSPSCRWPDSAGAFVLPVDPRVVLPLRG
jgi:hypothetical protein